MILKQIYIKGFRNYKEAMINFEKNTLIIGANDIGKTNLIYALRQLLAGSLKAAYDDMHQNRNRYAHNTLSYQQNLPSMKELVKGKESGNFYEWFFILTLLDKVFMNSFEGVKEVLEKNN